jgi:DNA ligase-1
LQIFADISNMKKLVILFILFIDIYGQNLQKAKIYHGYEDITEWLMSEKLDGIRAYWDGKELKSKNGNTIHAPKWFVKDFPPFELDGELWTKREDFENIQSIVLCDTPTDKWKEITYNIFEVPNHEGNFTHRLKFAKKYIQGIKHVKIINQIKCKSREHLNRFLNEVEKLGGEGVIIKNPKLSYFTGRSSNILKVKNFDDMEGKVISINKGRGKFKNMMGSLTLLLENNVTFKLGGGFNMMQRKNPPTIGKYITFKYYGLTKKKKPKFASFLRVREAE